MSLTSTHVELYFLTAHSQENFDERRRYGVVAR